MLKWEDVPSDLQELITTSTQRGIDRKQQGVDFGVSIADDVMLYILKNLCKACVDTSKEQYVDIDGEVECYIEIKNLKTNYLSFDDIVYGVVQVFKDMYNINVVDDELFGNKCFDFIVDNVVTLINEGQHPKPCDLKIKPKWWKWW